MGCAVSAVAPAPRLAGVVPSNPGGPFATPSTGLHANLLHSESTEEELDQIKFADLTLEEVIGEGSFGRVQRGRLFGLEVAVKHLSFMQAAASMLSQAERESLSRSGLPHIKSASSHGSYDSDVPTLMRDSTDSKPATVVALPNVESVLEMLRREVSIMRKLRHPNIVTYMAVCVEAPNFCIITEYVSGGSLAAVLRSRKRLKWSQYFDMAKGIAKGLTWLHKKRVIHRDLKPSNILVTKHGQVKIADFGLALLSRKDVEDPQVEAAGSPVYTAPEVYSGGEFDATSDIYSLGVVLCEMANGKQPYWDQPEIFLPPPPQAPDTQGVEGAEPAEPAEPVEPTNNTPPEAVATHSTDSSDVLHHFKHRVIEGARPTLPDIDSMPPGLADLIRACWSTDPIRRPHAHDVLEILELIEQDAPSHFGLDPDRQSLVSKSEARPSSGSRHRKKRSLSARQGERTRAAQDRVTPVSEHSGSEAGSIYFRDYSGDSDEGDRESQESRHVKELQEQLETLKSQVKQKDSALRQTTKQLHVLSRDHSNLITELDRLSVTPSLSPHSLATSIGRRRSLASPRLASPRPATPSSAASSPRVRNRSLLRRSTTLPGRRSLSRRSPYLEAPFSVPRSASRSPKPFRSPRPPVTKRSATVTGLPPRVSPEIATDAPFPPLSTNPRRVSPRVRRFTFSAGGDSSRPHRLDTHSASVPSHLSSLASRLPDGPQRSRSASRSPARPKRKMSGRARRTIRTTPPSAAVLKPQQDVPESLPPLPQAAAREPAPVADLVPKPPSQPHPHPRVSSAAQEDVAPPNSSPPEPPAHQLRPRHRRSSSKNGGSWSIPHKARLVLGLQAPSGSSQSSSPLASESDQQARSGRSSPSGLRAPVASHVPTFHTPIREEHTLCSGDAPRRVMSFSVSASVSASNHTTLAHTPDSAIPVRRLEGQPSSRQNTVLHTPDSGLPMTSEQGPPSLSPLDRSPYGEPDRVSVLDILRESSKNESQHNRNSSLSSLSALSAADAGSSPSGPPRSRSSPSTNLATIAASGSGSARSNSIPGTVRAT